jgi:hypothetical protein
VHKFATLILEFEVRDVERRNGLDRQRESFICARPTPLAAQIPPRAPQRAENLRAIKPLTLTVFAEIHRLFHLAAGSRSWPRLYFGPRARL